MLCSIPTGGALTKDYNATWTDMTVSGGQSLLVEELTATWCSSCTEIDPYLHQVADSHGSRISIVSYHPQMTSMRFSRRHLNSGSKT